MLEESDWLLDIIIKACGAFETVTGRKPEYILVHEDDMATIAKSLVLKWNVEVSNDPPAVRIHSIPVRTAGAIKGYPLPIGGAQ